MLEQTQQTSKIDALANLRAALGDSLFSAKPTETNTETKGLRSQHPVENACTHSSSGSTSAKTAREMHENKALKNIFPHGLPTGELIECLYRGSGCGALALCFARSVSRDGRGIAVIDPEHQFYPHAALALGIELQQLVIFRPSKGIDEMWVLDQTIRCRGFAAVFWRGEKIHVRHLRRLQLACQKYNTLGLLLRPQSMRHQGAAARTRLLVESFNTMTPTPSAPLTPSTQTVAHGISPTQQFTAHNKSSFFSFNRLRIKRLRGAHLAAGSGMEWEIDHENGTFRQAISLPVAS